MSENIVRRFKIDYRFDWTYGVEISKIREDLDAVEKMGAKEIQIEYDSEFGIEIRTFVNRLETDDERIERINVMKKLNQSIKERELKQLEQLKKKYENHD